MSIKNGDNWNGIRRPGKGDDELHLFLDEPYIFHRHTTSLVLVDAGYAYMLGCFMYQTASFAVVSRDDIPACCIIAIVNRADGAERYVNPKYDTKHWRNYLRTILSRSTAPTRANPQRGAPPTKAPPPNEGPPHKAPPSDAPPHKAAPPGVPPFKAAPIGYVPPKLKKVPPPVPPEYPRPAEPKQNPVATPVAVKSRVEPLAPSVEGGFIHADFQKH